MLRTFDCFTRILKFAKLFIVVEYIAPRRMWDAYIFNRSVATTPECLTCSSYKHLLERLAVFEMVEQNGGLK
jgi:hypothetical protein